MATPLWQQNGPFPALDVALDPEQVADFIVYLVSLPPDTMIAAPAMLPVKVRRRRAKKRPEGSSPSELEGSSAGSS